MVDNPGRASLFRTRSPGSHLPVPFVELFFDLVFVFAVTQLSHELRAHFSPLGLLETAMLMLAVWWVWIFTAWITNWLDPDRTPVRLMLLVLMLFGLVLSSSLPEAFEHRGLIFALAFVGMQVGRTIFMLVAIPASDVGLKRNFWRVLVWLVVSAVTWIAGGVAAGPLRLALWAVALVIEYLGPAVRFWTPGLGRSSIDDWNVDGPHLAERAGLFIIIALGESVLVIGDTFAETHWTTARLAAFVAAFVASVAMWWLYFDKGAELGIEQIRRASNPGRLGRNAYTYLHLPIVSGIVLFAPATSWPWPTPVSWRIFRPPSASWPARCSTCWASGCSNAPCGVVGWSPTWSASGHCWACGWSPAICPRWPWPRPGRWCW